MTTLTFEIAGVKSSSKNSARRNGSMQPLNSFLNRQITPAVLLSTKRAKTEVEMNQTGEFSGHHPNTLTRPA
nr:hypothetical protein [Escherichia coli]